MATKKVLRQQTEYKQNNQDNESVLPNEGRSFYTKL